MKYGLALLALALCSSTALGADLKLPTKAPSVYQGYPTGSGFYFGANAAMSEQKIDGVIQTTSVGAVTSSTGDVGLTLGYVWAQSGYPIWFGVEATLDYSNINGQNGFFSLNGPASFTQIAILGAPWDTVTSILPNLGVGPFPGLPVLPAGVTAGPGQLYIFAGAKERDIGANFGFQSFKEWEVSPIMGPGIRALLSNKTAVDVRFEYQPPMQTICAGPITTCVAPNASYTVRTSVLF